uniref:Major facilitator superfamily (MFS) profile domain-containing protein n=1 Tax=Phaeocystis antarctica TaxID=33657 RepID=A0A7S0NGA3_9EUKA|mmetsp:Transcript_8588/g.20222  ORF Transcript_8588/g.20222 Transcript_8588/m.20222 type:complete len:534 (+) Transcript_8588:94-1695(+)
MSARRNLIISAVSNLSTAYNLVVINVVHVIIGYQYCGGPSNCSAEIASASTSCLAGAIVGQLAFGYIGDCLGRPRALQLTMAMSILGALASAFAVPVSSDPASIFVFLTITRFFLGVGVGGVYPLSATIASESSETNARGRNASLVFSMQGVANLLVPLVAWALLQTCGVPQTDSRGDESGLSWRLALGLGALPGILLLPFKTSSRAAEPTSVAADCLDGQLVLNGCATAAAEPNPAMSMSEPPEVPMLGTTTPTTLLQALRMRTYWGKLMGTAGGWFLFDITFYGNSLFQPTVLHEVFFVAEANASAVPEPPFSGGLADNLCVQMALIALIGLPGYYLSVCAMDRLGRRFIQLQGFFFMAVVFALLGALCVAWCGGWCVADPSDLRPSEAGRALMLLLYGLTFFFSNFGPNSTTFMLPAETFPPNIRSTLSGFSAACGKLGATIGSAAFKPLSEHAGLPATMMCCAAVSLLGLGLTYCFVEDKRGARMEGEEDRSSVFCAHEGEGEGEAHQPQQQPAAQYGARGAVAGVGLH